MQFAAMESTIENKTLLKNCLGNDFMNAELKIKT
jgi:hypothetical protein